MLTYKTIQKLFPCFENQKLAGGLIMAMYDPLEVENASSSMIKDYARMIQACCKEISVECKNLAQDCESCANCESKCTD